MKKEAKEAVKKRLEQDQTNLRAALRSGKYQINALVKTQTRMKRELAVLHTLIREVTNGPR